jgi:hypothetical protein
MTPAELHGREIVAIRATNPMAFTHERYQLVDRLVGTRLADRSRACAFETSTTRCVVPS